jgi:glycosyltransferase involved in cell wall biosynthesis
MLVCSDSIKFLAKANELDFVYTIPGEMAHIAFHEKLPTEVVLKSFVDYFMLAHSRKLYLVVEGQMYPSDFTYQASLHGSTFVEKRYYSQPLITIFIVTYNRAHFIKNAIDSALCQIYQNIEILIIDDGSTDNTEDIVKNYTDNKIKYVKKDNEGYTKSLNKMIHIAKGEFLLKLDDDDIIDPKICQIYVDVINKYNVDVIYCNRKFINLKTNEVSFKQNETKDYRNNERCLIENKVSCKGSINSGGSLIRKELLVKLGGYDEDLIRTQDSEMWTRLAPIAKFYKVEQFLYKMGLHDNNVTNGQSHLLCHSFDSLIIKKILSRNSLKTIYASIDWSEKDAETQAMYEVATGFFKYNDFQSAIEILNKTNYESHNKLLELYIKTNIGLSNFEVASEYTNKLSDVAKNTKQTNMLKTIQFLKIIHDKLSENQKLTKEEELFITNIKEDLSFFPSVYYLYMAFSETDEHVKFKYFMRSITANTKQNIAYNFKHLFVKNPKQQDEFEQAIQRMNTPIVFYKDTTVSENDNSYMS